MSNYAILRFKKLKSLGAIASVEAHNARTRPVPNADPSKANQQLYGSGNALADIEALWSQQNIKPRKNGVLGIEYVLTDSPDAMHNMSEIELKKWADASVEFIKKRHGEGLVAAWLRTLHLHVLTTPITQKVVRGKLKMRLSAKDFLDGRDKLSKLQDDYASHMKMFGLKRGVKGSTAQHRTLKKLLSLTSARRAQSSKSSGSVSNQR